MVPKLQVGEDTVDLDTVGPNRSIEKCLSNFKKIQKKSLKNSN